MPERSAKKVCQTQLHCRISWGIKLDSAHCLSSRILHSMPGHLRICAMPEATCSRRSPPLPQRPVFSTFLRAGLHFGCRTTSSRDLTATRWGNCTTRGSDTPATRCTTASYRAKPPTTTGTEGARRLQDREQCRLARNTRPARPPQRQFREKTRPASAKTPNLGCFEGAGRTFSRPARQLLEIKTVKAKTTRSHCPREAAGTNAPDSTVLHWQLSSAMPTQVVQYP